MKAKILNLAQRLHDANNKETQRNLVKVLTLELWKVLPVEERRKFLSRVWICYPYDFIEWEKRFPDCNDAELENVARHWGYVMPTLSGDDVHFGRSFEKLIRFRKTPSEKQSAWAKRLFSDWKTHRVEDETPDEIEVTE